MVHHADIAIVGGGVIGLTTAYFLARDGVSVDLLERGDVGQEASWAGAGILPPGNPSRARMPFDQLRAHSAALFPTLSTELRDRTGIDNGYLRSGGLEFALDHAGSEAQEWRGEGIAVERWDAPTMARHEPEVAAPAGVAWHLPDMAQIRNPRHLKALVAGCAALGVSISTGCPVFGLVKRGARVISLKTQRGEIGADQFVLATGAWTEPLLEQTGWQLGIHPIRGQIALLQIARPLFRRILMWGSRYLVPRPDGRVLVGSTEEDVGFDKRTTAAAIQDLLGMATALVPALGEAHLERCWSGLRPASPDGVPFIGRVPGCDNLFVAAGHFRAGLQLSPGTALVMKELLLSQPLTMPLEAFRLERSRP
jgi:glycine oxidase